MRFTIDIDKDLTLNNNLLLSPSWYFVRLSKDGNYSESYNTSQDALCAWKKNKIKWVKK